MLDVKFIRQNPDLVRDAVKKKGMDGEVDIDRILELDGRRRSILSEVEKEKYRRNTVSEKIGEMKKRGEEPVGLLEEMKAVSSHIKELDEEVARIEEELQELLLWVPNPPHPSVPVGPDETGNVEVRRWGTPREFAFEPKAHWDIGSNLGILDFERATKIAGSRFTVFWGVGARLVRALISFMIDLHVKEQGYTEVLPPFMVNEKAMIGTAQLPKFAEDAFRLAGDGFYLVPTAEVPVTNLHREEILDGSELPLYYVAYTPCFRSEAGSHGKDTRGLIRQHQFDKVELVKFVLPETSFEELERLTEDAAEVLRRLDLPYRVIEMCTGDMGFAQAKKYDIEVWMPSYGRYVEISSCSNFGDFQARRANIRFRRTARSRPEYVHTLNGSGLAVGRTVAAILENCQEADGSVTVPRELRPYLGGLKRIEGRSEKDPATAEFDEKPQKPGRRPPVSK
ncbi:MAG TPA: serine--tRNA ligase [Clostridia bacterium]|nr:serine--tRNA ligase [Clostridia bacterium]